MRENNFEKAVRQKLDDLILTPSEPLWLRVEAAIKKKRERRLLMVLLPLLLVSGLAAWWLLAKPVALNQQAAEIENKTKAEEGSTFSKPHAVPQQSNLKKEGTATLQTPKEVENDLPVSVLSTMTKNTFTKIKGSNPLTEKSSRQTANSYTKTNEDPAATFNRLANETQFLIYPEELKTNLKFNRIFLAHVPTQFNTRPVIVHQTIADSVATKMKIRMDRAGTFLLQTKARTLEREWLWTVAARAGTSNFAQAISVLGTQKSLFANAPGRYNQSGPTGNASDLDSTGNRYINPATTTQGLFLSIGFGLQKKIGKRFAFSTGLQYHFYSNHQAVGAPLSADSLLAIPNANFALANAQVLFRNNNRTRTVTNQVHLLELPLGFAYAPLRKLPLQVEAGLAISQLASGRVMQYDGRTNIYYQDKSTLRKTGISLFAGIDYKLWKSKTVALYAGPYAQYGLRALAETTSNSHLTAAGVSVRAAF